MVSLTHLKKIGELNIKILNYFIKKMDFSYFIKNILP